MSTSNHNIYYIFGAGASAGKQLDYSFPVNIINDGKIFNEKKTIKFNSFPLANSFTETLANYMMWINFQIDSNESKIPELKNRYEEFKYYIAEIFAELSKIALRFNTIDEAAKFYYIKGRTNELLELKKEINKIFNFIDFLIFQRDPRYIQHLITLVNKQNKIPENIHFLSWNYDNQFEIANRILFGDSEPNIKKLNGSSPFFDRYFEGYINSWENNFEIIRPETINAFESEFLHFEQKKYANSIRFSWEKEAIGFNNDVINAIKAIKTTNNILVYIGYSHPFVNFPMDSELIKTINPKKVYLQDPNFKDSYNVVFKERYELKCDVEIINDCNRFFIPNEFFINSSIGEYRFG